MFVLLPQRPHGVAGGAEVHLGRRERRAAARQDEGVRAECQETGQGASRAEVPWGASGVQGETSGWDEMRAERRGTWPIVSRG